MPSKKSFVLDTNVLLHDPQAIFNFSDATVVVPITVLDELDSFKGERSDRGRSAREAIRNLDNIRKSGSLGEGVALDSGGIVKVVFPKGGQKRVDGGTADDEILRVAVELQDSTKELTFISKDINARVKADALGLQVLDYRRDKNFSTEDFYKGWRRLQVPSVQLKSEIPKDLKTLGESKELCLNEFVVVESNHNPHHHKLFRYLGLGKFKLVVDPKLKVPVEAKNVHQLMALDLLMDDSIPCVGLVGPAGTGKTFLALLAGLHKVLVEDIYSRMLIARSIVPLGQDIGYLPGDVREKLHSWMQPVYDNMDLISHTVTTGTIKPGGRREEKARKTIWRGFIKQGYEKKDY